MIKGFLFIALLSALTLSADRKALAEAGDDLSEPVAVVVGRVGLEVGAAMVEGDGSAVPRAPEKGVRNQPVVLAEAHEHAAEHQQQHCRPSLRSKHRPRLIKAKSYGSRVMDTGGW